MASFCNTCGAALTPGSAFCGGCGSRQAVAPPASNVGGGSGGGGSTLPWIVALIAVLLLGVAGGYILLNRDKGADQLDPAKAEAAAAPVEATAAPDKAPAAAEAPPAAPVAPATPARVSGGTSNSGAHLMGSYTAYIGQEDLYASDGVRLTQPWQILRQDRANVHRFGIRQAGDSGDSFFAGASNRATMERMVMQGSISPAAARAIVAGGATVQVSIYGDGRIGRYLDITVN